MTKFFPSILSVTNKCLLSSAIKTENVSLKDNAADLVDITSTKKQGSYILIITPTSAEGATATFAISSGEINGVGHVVRISSSPASTNEELDIIWPANSSAKIYHSVLKSGGIGNFIQYQVKIY